MTTVKPKHGTFFVVAGGPRGSFGWIMDNEKARSAYGRQSKVDRAYLCTKRLRGFANCTWRDAWGTYTGTVKTTRGRFLHQAGSWLSC